jgi:hypothetical protein
MDLQRKTGHKHKIGDPESKSKRGNAQPALFFLSLSLSLSLSLDLSISLLDFLEWFPPHYARVWRKNGRAIKKKKKKTSQGCCGCISCLYRFFSSTLSLSLFLSLFSFFFMFVAAPTVNHVTARHLALIDSVYLSLLTGSVSEQERERERGRKRAAFYSTQLLLMFRPLLERLTDAFSSYSAKKKYPSHRAHSSR